MLRASVQDVLTDFKQRSAAASPTGLGSMRGDDLWVFVGQDRSYSEWWRTRITLRGFLAS